MTPESLKIQFTEILGREILGIQKLSGGCSYPSYLIECKDGRYFLKTNGSSTEVFNREVTGLKTLKQNGANIPEVVAFDFLNLVIGYIETTAPKKEFWENLAIQLAEVHKNKGPQFGLGENNFIGAADQKNITPKDTTWADFFWNNRLNYKLSEINKKGESPLDPQQIAKLKSVTYKLLENHTCHPSPLHGDLWNGNILCGTGQKAFFIDPAFYYGDRETDIAMTECFGGFDPHFYDTYNKHYPLEEGYKNRKHLYNLYHLLNHHLIFGEQYTPPVVDIFSRLTD